MIGIFSDFSGIIEILFDKKKQHNNTEKKTKGEKSTKYHFQIS